MSNKAILEMVCDWIGAGKAQGNISPKDKPLLECQKWYEKNKKKIQFSPETKELVENLLYDKN